LNKIVTLQIIGFSVFG